MRRIQNHYRVHKLPGQGALMTPPSSTRNLPYVFIYLFVYLFIFEFIFLFIYSLDFVSLAGGCDDGRIPATVPYRSAEASTRGK